MLVCHGNNDDIGRTNPITMAEKFNVNICMFDYAGYGLHSCNQSSEKAAILDTMAVFYHLVTVKNIQINNIIIYGRSLGSGMACYLAHHLSEQQSQSKLSNIDHEITNLENKLPTTSDNGLSINKPKCLILVSPLMSAAKTLIDIHLPCDIFMNYILAPKITYSTLIIHGTKDTVVPYSCALELSKLFPGCVEFVSLNDRGHCNIWTPYCYDKIKEFIRNNYNNSEIV
jgi:hypothetical protein